MQRGFTVIEVIVAMAIIAILTAIAYPSYVTQTQKSRRADAKAALANAAIQMERYYTERNTYATATLGSGGVYASQSDGGYYTLALSNLSAANYLLSAVPTGPQTADKCGTLTLNAQGVKGVTGNGATVAECW